MSSTEYRLVAGTDGKYKVGSNGDVIGPRGFPLSGGITKGYRSISLSLGNKTVERRYVSSLVWEAFVGEIGSDVVISHKDGDKLNCNIENLAVVSRSECSKMYRSRSPSPKRTRPKRSKPQEFPSELRWSSTCPDGYLVSSCGRVWSNKSRYILSPGTNGAGYLYVNLNGKNHSIHRLVYSAFNGKIPDGMVIDHVNGNKGDNSISNLRCVTHKKNSSSMPFGEIHASSTLVDSQVSSIKAMISSGFSDSRVAEFFGVSKSTIGYIRRGERWSHIT